MDGAFDTVGSGVVGDPDGAFDGPNDGAYDGGVLGSVDGVAEDVTVGL